MAFPCSEVRGYWYWAAPRNGTTKDLTLSAGDSDAAGRVSATASYRADSCVQVPEENSNILGMNYRNQVTDNPNLNAALSYGSRTSKINPTFYNPMQADGEGYENYAQIAFFDASRKEGVFKAGLNWQATTRAESWRDMYSNI